MVYVVKFLKECGIYCSIYHAGQTKQNGVDERRNRTLEYIVRSMLSNLTLPGSLWGEAPKGQWTF